MGSKCTAIVVGATGLVGGELLNLLLDHDKYGKIIVPSRSTLPIQNPKLENIVESFEAMEKHPEAFKADEMFFCFGTTLGKAGSREEFERIEKGYSYKLFKLAEEGGVKKLFLITAAGSNSESSILYNRVKGEIEQFAYDCSFDSVYIFRPGLLLGNRKEKRPLENLAVKFAGPLMKPLNMLTKGRLAVPSLVVAKSMVKAAENPEPGVHIVTNSMMLAQ